MAKRFEGSPQDKAGDAHLAKKAGITAEQFEGSPGDELHDLTGKDGDNRAKARSLSGEGRASEPAARSGNATPDHAFAHRRPVVT
jgi:hypothetical protein